VFKAAVEINSLLTKISRICKLQRFTGNTEVGGSSPPSHLCLKRNQHEIFNVLSIWEILSHIWCMSFGHEELPASVFPGVWGRILAEETGWLIHPAKKLALVVNMMEGPPLESGIG